MQCLIVSKQFPLPQHSTTFINVSMNTILGMETENDLLEIGVMKREYRNDYVIY